MSISSVLIGPSSFAELDRSPIEKLIDAGYQVIDNPYKRRLTREELKTLLGPDVCGIVAGLEPLDRDVLTGTNVKVISRVGSGLSNVDLKATEALRIQVCSTPNAPTEAVAELALGALLSMLRMIPQMSNALHADRWEKCIGTELFRKTVAIIGYGRIGRRFAELLRPFQVEIIVVDPIATSATLTDERLLSLQDALLFADIITLHTSGETCLIAEPEIAKMKSGVFLLNVARGGVISESALLKGVKEEKIAGAWLDTFVDEPYSGPLLEFPQVILTPHVGSYTRECRVAMENEAVENFINAMKKYEL